MFRKKYVFSVWAPCLLSCHWASLKGAWLCLLCIPTLSIYKHWQDPTRAFSSPGLTILGKKSLSRPFITLEILKILNILCGPLLLSLQYVHVSLVSLLVGTELITALQVRSGVVRIIQKQIFLNTSAMCALLWTLLQPIFQSLGF